MVHTLLKGLQENRPSLILYVLYYGEPSRLISKNEIISINENNFELLKHMADLVGLEDALSLPNSYVEVVKSSLPDEFSFYEDSPVPDGFVFPPFSASIIKNIEKKNMPVYMLEYIRRKVYNKPELISKLLNKKKYVEFIPGLAKILSKSIKNSKTFCSSILSAQLNRENATKELMLIAECYKFGLFTVQELFDLINQLIEDNLIFNLCILLEHVGRYIFYKKESNRLAIEMVEKIKQSPMDSASKIRVSQCISTIINSEFSKINIFDFIRWFLNSTEYEKSEVFEKMKQSRRLVLIILAQPGIFENDRLFRNFVDNVGFIDSIFLIRMYLSVIPKVPKTQALDYINAISILATHYDQQAEVLDTLSSNKMNSDQKDTLIIFLLNKFDSKLHAKYLKMFSKNENPEIRAMVFNFCEEYKYDYVNEDSFEREMHLLE